jgi:sporulation protein YlmC with PRC-barrel domain
MIRATDLMGCVVGTESGDKLGRVHDLRARHVDGGWSLVALVIGKGGLKERLAGGGDSPVLGGDVVPWEAITRLEDGLVVVRDGTQPSRSA